MIGPFKVLRLVRKNRSSIPIGEFQKLGLLVSTLGILHTYIFYMTAGRFFPDSIMPRLILMTFLVGMLIFTLLYVRGIKLVKKYNLSE